MAVTTAVLSGNITDLTGDLNAAYLKRVVIVIEANSEGSLLLDTDGNRILAGAKRVTIDTTTGAYTITLPKTDSADILPSGARLYKVTLVYPNGTPGAGNVTLQSGWWELEADGSLSDADKWPGLEVTVVSQAVLDSIADMAADVEDRWTDVMGVVATTDGLMSAVDADDESDFRVQQDARLADTYVAKDVPGFDIIVLLGQSNMSGRGLTFDATTDPSDGRIFQYGATGINSRQIILASEPLVQHDTATGIGPGLPFARWHSSANPNRKVLLVGAAHGSTGFETTGEFTWKVGNTTQTNLYDLAIAQTKDALANAGPGSRIAAVLWHQGENDGNISVSQATYTADLQALISGFRTAVGVADLPFILGQLSPANIAATAAMAAIDAAHQAVAAADANTAFAFGLPGATNTGDIVHYNAAGARFLGRGMFDQYAALELGAAAPTVPAQVTGLATSAGISSTSITVHWTAIPDALGYYLEYRTTSGPGAWTAGPAITTGLSATVDHLTANTSYDLRGRAVNSAGPGTWSSTLTVSTPNPTLVFSDTVTRANSTTSPGTPDVGSAWSDPLTKFGVISNTLYHVSASATAGDYATVDVGTADGEFSVTFATIPTAGSAQMRYLFRYSDASNYWTVFHRRATSKYQLYRVNAGNSTQIGPDFAATPANGDVIKVVLHGSDIQVYVNGTLQTLTTVTDSFNSTATKIGFGHGATVSAADVARWDNFTVYV